MRLRLLYILTLSGLLCACRASGTSGGGDSSQTEEDYPSGAAFDADSAYYFIERQVSFGPRVPNSEAHRKTGDWLVERLRQSGAKVIEQPMSLRAFDGTMLSARNIFAQYNPEATDRLLLLAHWDCRPWADQDPDETRRHLPVDGANDGASGVGVLLEIARQLGKEPVKQGIDILFVDAEDWGDEGDDTSWAMGTRYFMEHPPVAGYSPSQAILLDMVGSADATFGHEYFSSQSAPALINDLWAIAADLGYGNLFVNSFGGAVTDDHTQLIAHGVPAIDIIDYRHGSMYQGFDPVWHTTSDGMDNISRATLEAVGRTVTTYIRRRDSGK